MASLYLVARAAFVAGRDAVLPHLARFSESPCQFLALSTNVHAGRTQAVCTSRRGPACCEALQEHRSRGCRALRLFCRWSWLPSWQLAPVMPKKTSSMSTNRSRSSRPTPASTTKTIGRAKGAIAPRPALFLSGDPASGRLSGVAQFVLGVKRRYGEALETIFVWRFSCGRLPSLPLWPLQPSLPVRSPHLSLSRCPSQSSPRRLASTARNNPERACRGNRPAPVPTLRAPQLEVRPC